MLTREQVEKLSAARATYGVSVDSVWSELGEHLAGLNDDYNPSTELERTDKASATVWELSRLSVQQTLPKILVPLQLGMLPWPVNVLLESSVPVHLRIFMP